MKTLSDPQKKLLDLFIRTIDDPLTIREIQAKMAFSSTSVAVHHIRQLERKGYLRRDQYNPRSYEIVSGGPEKPIVYLNLFGMAQCSTGGSILDGNPVDRIPVSTRLLNFSSRDAFMVKAKGDSMEPRIFEGDYVIAKKTRAVTSETLIVCVNDEEAMIKKYHRKGNQIFLTSLNARYTPILASDDFRIEGEVRGVISSKLR
jgi:repressor LexA